MTSSPACRRIAWGPAGRPKRTRVSAIALPCQTPRCGAHRGRSTWRERPAGRVDKMADPAASAIAGAMRRVTMALPAGGEDRPGQVTMAEAVGRAITEKKHLVVQAGTGTGKSLAYLTPALLSGVKTVVATATKALQDQLRPRICRCSPRTWGSRSSSRARGPSQLSVHAKGPRDRRNGGWHLDARQQQRRRGDRTGNQAGTGVGGDVDNGRPRRARLRALPRVWNQLSVSAMDCPGRLRCPAGEVCFAEAARRKAEEAAVVVVNTHLYGAHLASGGHVLPDHDLVVFDEAHELEDIAVSSLGIELGVGGSARWRRWPAESSRAAKPQTISRRPVISSRPRSKSTSDAGSPGRSTGRSTTSSRLARSACRSWSRRCGRQATGTPAAVCPAGRRPPRG